MVRPTLLLLVVLAVAGTMLASRLNRGWFPHDEGALGQSAERVLAGEVPHRDFDEIYTGLLTYMHAGAFAIGGRSSMTMRLLLFLFAMAWVAAIYGLALRFAPPLGAALATTTAFVWSVPNYPAPMPSWYNLFLATFGALALIRAIDTGRRRWLVIAGVTGGLSFLFKLSGIFFLLGGGLALLAATPPVSASDSLRRPSRASAVVISIALLGILVALSRPMVRIGPYTFVRLLLPLALPVTALILREWNTGGQGLRTRVHALAERIGPFTLGAAVPIACWAIFLLVVGALPATIDGVLVTPFRRLQFASMLPPPPTAFVYTLGIGALLSVPREWPGARVFAAVAALAASAIIVLAAERPGLYAIGWLAAWGLPLLAAFGAVALLRIPERPQDNTATAAVMLAIIALGVTLVEFPFSAPIYTLYALPLTMIAVVAVTRAGGRAPAALQVVVVGFLLAFGIWRVNPASVRSLGVRFARSTDMTVLELPRSGLRIYPVEAASYEAMISLVQDLEGGRQLWAGPDAPEVYFLSGIPNRTRTTFDFLDAASTSQTLIERIRTSGASLVVLKLIPLFSAAPDRETIAALRAEFPHAQTFSPFLVLWK